MGQALLVLFADCIDRVIVNQPPQGRLIQNDVPMLVVSGFVTQDGRLQEEESCSVHNRNSSQHPQCTRVTMLREDVSTRSDRSNSTTRGVRYRATSPATPQRRQSRFARGHNDGSSVSQNKFYK